MLKKRIDQFIKNNFIKLECSPEMPSYLCLKILTNYLRSKYLRYEYCITNLPSNDINTIFINYNPNLLKEECFNLRIEDCKTCILRKFNQFVSCKFEFVTLFEYFSKLIGKSNLLCKECISLKDEIILFEKKEKYPV
ncbi:hypothetical protein TUBRATIS_12170 [Tubulinosema ratisbonensis]|uniref:Uncharacterized protein n=1 Tax=Tubulinosema ratisbonensis TaxID=291195 RepID=A0A437AM85_9MICR|nr:hypothetical protein TUBRATIS_12170 [Tubulinosema ratisbonensis]